MKCSRLHAWSRYHEYNIHTQQIPGITMTMKIVLIGKFCVLSRSDDSKQIQKIFFRKTNTHKNYQSSYDRPGSQGFPIESSEVGGDLKDSAGEGLFK